jgi:hypothetical protein
MLGDMMKAFLQLEGTVCALLFAACSLNLALLLH